MCANLKSAGIVQPFIVTGNDALLLYIVCHTLPIFSWLFFPDSESDNTRDRTGCYLSHRTKLEPVQPSPQGRHLKSPAVIGWNTRHGSVVTSHHGVVILVTDLCDNCSFDDVDHRCCWSIYGPSMSDHQCIMTQCNGWGWVLFSSAAASAALYYVIKTPLIVI